MDGCTTITPARHTERSRLLRDLAVGTSRRQGERERLCVWAMISLHLSLLLRTAYPLICVLYVVHFIASNIVDNNLCMLNGKLGTSFWASCITVVAVCCTESFLLHTL